MNIYGFIPLNVRPIEYAYTLDESVSSVGNIEYTREGFGFSKLDGLDDPESVSVNKHNVLYLTGLKSVNDIFKTVTQPVKYPYFHTTYLKLSGRDAYWILQPSTGVVSVTSTVGTSNQNIFELEFISSRYATVRHYDNNSVKYLTLNPSTVSAVSFATRIDPSNINVDTQIFSYVLDNESNQITLFNILSSSTGDIPSIITCIDSTKRLSGSTIPDTYSLYTSGNTFEIIPQREVVTNFDVNNTWYSYLSSIDDNNLLVNTTKSVTGVKNNFLITTATNDIDSQSNIVDINLLPLKNQFTVENTQSRNNPYSNTTNDITHREYHNTHTGTHETGGLNNIFLTYTSNTKEVLFEPDKLTYFHTPQTLEPYDQLNINDATLVKSGAIAGDVPIKSDKVFKKRTSNTKRIRDELNGTWLCAWLSGSPNPNIEPVWVDRYYNPDVISSTLALTVGIHSPVVYVDKFTSLVTHLSAKNSNLTVFDKKSDLIFEPNNIYAYHHIGKGNSQRVIDSLSNFLAVTGIKTYRNSNFTKQVPNQDNSKTTHIMPDGRVMTGISHSIESVEIPKIYNFDNNNYALTDSIVHKGSFTLNFWLYSDNWSKPFADQIVGNYITKGFGIFNEPSVTPIIAIPDNTRVHIYNTDFKYIDTHILKQNIKCFTKRGSLENYWFVDTSNNVYEYTINGVIQNKITSSLIANKNIVDIDVDDTFLYLLIEPPGATAEVLKYDLSNQDPAYQGLIISPVPVWNIDHVESPESARVFSVKTGNVASSGVIVTAADGVSGAAAVANSITGGLVFGSNSIIDNNGNPWAINQNKIFTYHTATSSIITALTATEIIQGISCDRDNNIWVLHNHTKLTKLSNDRIKTFTVTLTSLLLPVSAVPYNKYIDFVSEFRDGKYRDYAIVINQSLSGCRAVKFDINGNTSTDVVLLTSDNNNIKFFNTPMSLSGSWKTITGYDYLRRNKLNAQPRIEAKLSLTNLYNSTTTTASYSSYTLTHTTTGLTKGWHNINVTFDSENGVYELKINTISVDKVTIPVIKFSHNNIFEQPLTIGSSPYYTRLVLFDFIKQTTGYLGSGIKVKNLKLYNKVLNSFDVNAHYMVESNSTPVKWDIPVGQRNYIDTVERVFKARIPGRKSEKYTLNIKNSELTDENVKRELEKHVLSQLEEINPVNVTVKNILWDNAVISTSAINATL